MNDNSMEFVQGLRYVWQLAAVDASLVATYAAQFNLSYPVIQAALARGYHDKEALERYLFTPSELVQPAHALQDMDKALDRIVQAIRDGEKILIAGDYDVDGITSSALMMTCLLPLGAQANFFLPHRVHDGYGLSVKTIRRAAQSGYRVVVTVDNGITAYEPAQEARALGIDLIITDHHRPHEQLPDAYAVIDPYRSDCPSKFKKYAGVGVSFKLMSLLYERLGKKLPEKVYELLLLGTVADVVPLIDENRYWVRQGLRLVNGELSYALSVLRNNAGVTKSALSSTDIGFFITPQINALGRLEDPREGVKFLIGSDEQETERIGRVLGQLNQARKQIERSIVEDIVSRIESGIINLEQEKIIIATSSEWPPGVIGLVAGRIANTYMRPTILLHVTDKGIAKGSCRSIPALNMFEALQSVKDKLISFGGHAQAAGLSLSLDILPKVKEELERYCSERLTPDDFKPRLAIDGELLLSEAHKKLCDELAYLEPFGCENPRPLFRIRGVSLVDKPQLLKEAHVKCMITAEGVIKPVIFFSRPELYELMCARRDDIFDIVVSVVENEWQGRVSVEFQGFDIMYNA